MTLTSSIFGVPCLALANLTTGGTGATILTRILYHDRMGRLFGIVTANSTGAHLSRHDYTLDKAGRRTRATRENGQRWDYGYDTIGQVTSGVKKFPNGDPIPGHSFAFEFDGIGNRTAATHGGANTAVTYTPDALNQYEEIETEGGRFILGEAPPANDVFINGDTTPAARAGGLGFYWKQITADNSAGPLWSTDTVESGGVTITGQAWTPAASVAPEYDFDGNLTNDGRWDYLWDAEHTRRIEGWADCAEHSPARGDFAMLGQNHQNRLIRMTTATAAANHAGVPRQRLDFVYDSQGRRVSKTVSTSPDGNTWTVAANRRFLYDVWNPIAEYSAPSPTSTSLTHEASYLWGLDLSGTPQGAGGVGGLLAVRLLSSVSESSVFPAYDGNGNITAWIGPTGALLARMDYSPFGQLVAHHKFTSDTILSRLPFGFSTKYTDPETGLLYYGHRYYDPVNGRWPSRDPIGERGGVNLYGFVGNRSLSFFDSLGLERLTIPSVVINEGFSWQQDNGIGSKSVRGVTRFIVKTVVDTKTGKCITWVGVPIAFRGGTVRPIGGDAGQSGVEDLPGYTPLSNREVDEIVPTVLKKMKTAISARWNGRFEVCCDEKKIGQRRLLDNPFAEIDQKMPYESKTPAYCSTCCELRFLVYPDDTGVPIALFRNKTIRDSTTHNWNIEEVAAGNGPPPRNPPPGGGIGSVAAHEFGHFLGNVEDYGTASGIAHPAAPRGVPFPGLHQDVPDHGTSVMGNDYEGEGAAQQRHLWRVLSAIEGSANYNKCSIRRISR